jgi:hypothetical protein
MINKLSIAILMISAILINGCIKDTYDMNKLSEEVHFSPSLVIPGVKGHVSFSDIVKSGDTIVVDQNNLVKVIFKQDSVINFQLADFFDFGNMVSFKQSYQIGVLSIGSFQGTLSMSLSQITQNMSTTLRNQILLLDDGATHNFPPFPSVNLGERTFSAFNNFDNAVFQSGYLDISVTNNLTTPISAINIILLNSVGRTSIGTLSIPAALPGQTSTASIDLTDKMLTNSVIAAVVLTGSTGTTTPVIISLNNSNIALSARGRDLKIKSGRIILPTQKIATLDNKDTISFNPGFGIELDEIKITSGNLSYDMQSGTSLAASVSLTLPTVKRGGIPLTHTITSGTGSRFTGSVSFNNTTVSLGSDPSQPFNKIPLVYSIEVGSNNTFINYNSTDKIDISLNLVKPTLDYVK